MFTPGNSDLPDNGVLALAPGDDGALWVGTWGGLARLAGGQVDQVLTTEQGLPDNKVLALAPGDDGALWVGTEGGLARLAGGQVDQVLTTEQGLPDNEFGRWRRATTARSGSAPGAGWRGSPAARSTRCSPPSRACRTTRFGAGAGRDGALWVGTGAGWRGSPAAKSTRCSPPSRACRTTGFGRWRRATTARSGSARRRRAGAARRRPVDQVLHHRAGTCRTTMVWRWRRATTARSGSAPTGGLARLAGGQSTRCSPPSRACRTTGPGAGAGRRRRALGRHRGRAGAARRRPVDQVLTTEQGLPDNDVQALAPGGTARSGSAPAAALARLKPPVTPPRIVKLVGQLGSEGAKITQAQHTFAAIAFDPKYQTDGREWRFLWRLDPPSGEPGETRTRSSYYEAVFEDDGRHRVTVQAIDEYGLRSEPYVYAFDVALPKEDPVEIWAERIGVWGLALSAVYFLGLFPLLLLYPRASWARSAVTSGVFTKFPVLHKLILNSDWARRLIFRRHAETSIAAAQVPEHYISQAVFRAVGTASTPLALDGASASLAALFEVFATRAGARPERHRQERAAALPAARDGRTVPARRGSEAASPDRPAHEPDRRPQRRGADPRCPERRCRKGARGRRGRAAGRHPRPPDSQGLLYPADQFAERAGRVEGRGSFPPVLQSRCRELRHRRKPGGSARAAGLRSISPSRSHGGAGAGLPAGDHGRGRLGAAAGGSAGARAQSAGSGPASRGHPGAWSPTSPCRAGGRSCIARS